MIRSIAAAALLAAAVAAPASAVTFVTNFGGTVGSVASVAVTTGGVTLTATSRKFFILPGNLTNLSQTSAIGQIRRTAPGIGVNGGASSPQMDTNQPGTVAAPLREAILISGSEDFSLRGLKLSFIDNDDTLKIYGVQTDGALIDLGYGTTATVAGTIKGGLNGAAIGLVNSSPNDGTSAFGLAPTSFFTRYLFTSRVGGDAPFLGTLGQGYRIDSITTNVPEPASWMMLIAGFGLVGFAARRRSNAVAA